MSNENSSPNEIFVFKNDRNAANISEKLLDFYKDNEFFDTVLVAGTESLEVQAHRIVLSASSEYFLELFRSNTTILNVFRTELKEIDSSTFKSIIDFMYYGFIELTLENAESILRTAMFLKMKILVEGCNDFFGKNITLNFSNCLNSLRLAKKLNLSVLKEKALNFAYSHFEKISKENDILLLNDSELKDLLFYDNPYGDFEEHVFLTLVAWIGYDTPNRKNLTLQLLSMVRYQFLTPKFIIENRKSVCKTVDSYELICSWLEWHLSPETRSVDQQHLQRRKVDSKLAAISCEDVEKLIKIQTYDKKTKAWSIVKRIPLWIKKEIFSMIIIAKKLIVVGGFKNGGENRIECLDLHTSEWVSLPPMRKRRVKSQLEHLNGNLYVFGGLNKNGFVHSLEEYNFTTRKWQDLQPPYEPSEWSRIAAHDGILYIADFKNGYLQFFDVSTKQWTFKELEEKELSHFGFAAVQGFLYIIGGWNPNVTNTFSTVNRYNLANNTWSEVAPLPHGRKFMKTVVFENKIIICGGDPHENIIQEYNLNTNTWTTSNSLLIGFSKYDNLICAVANDLF